LQLANLRRPRCESNHRGSSCGKPCASRPTERLKRDGVEPVGGTPDAFGALIAGEIMQWHNLAQSAKITLD
jgi:hypothetical protein